MPVKFYTHQMPDAQIDRTDWLDRTDWENQEYTGPCSLFGALGKFGQCRPPWEMLEKYLRDDGCIKHHNSFIFLFIFFF